MEQTESWSYEKLFEKTFPYEVPYFSAPQKESFIGEVLGFGKVIAETLYRLKYISNIIIENLKTIKREYCEDPDDPPLQRISETLYFIKCENYMTSFGLLEFNLNYVLFKTKFMRSAGFNFTQKALEETPEIPPNEYVWFGCPLEMRAIDIQIAYYHHWQHFGENEKVSRKEINDIIRIGFDNYGKYIYDLVIKYNLTDADFI
jgi:hypothetical protein